MVVFTPALHVARFVHNPVHVGAVPHTPGCPPAPHACPVGHALPQSSAFPQPSPAGPQLKPWSAQLRGAHWAGPAFPPHLSKPPPPQ
jgi:hypothetical protein